MNIFAVFSVKFSIHVHYKEFFSHELKPATVILTHKGACDSSPNNYRLISMLSPFAKVFESLILTRMSKFIAENEI